MVEENYAEVRGFSWAWCDKTNELCESNKVLLTDLEASTASVTTPVEEKNSPVSHRRKHGQKRVNRCVNWLV